MTVDAIPSTKPLNVAIVGAGIIGNNHAKALLRLREVRISAVVDSDTEAGETLTARIADQTCSKPRRFDRLSEALADADVDVIVICVPTGAHLAVAEEALGAGCHVVVEKPLDASLAAARRLANLATAAVARGQVFAVVSQHRFDPASVAIASAVAAGDLGRITSAVASVAWWRSQDYYDSAGWRGTWAQDGGGATMNQGVHTVDLLLWYLGEPVEVFAYTAILAHERIEVEDVAVATVRFASGALAVLHATTAAYPGLAVRLAVYGSRGSAVIHDDQLEFLHIAGAVRDDDANHAAAAGDGDDTNQAAAAVPAAEVRGGDRGPDSFVAGHLRQYRDIVDAINEHRPAAVGADDALLAVAVVKAMYVSAHRNGPISVAAVLAGDFDDVLTTVEK
jgi:UDP-N-acetyl-2-amino-2-deoxyglucuronate dehydrogenase